jgi:hypothetical protein
MATAPSTPAPEAQPPATTPPARSAPVTDAEKIRAALDAATSSVAGKLSNVTGTGSEVERIALDAVHGALVAFGNAYDNVFAEDVPPAEEDQREETPAQSARKTFAASPPSRK